MLVRFVWVRFVSCPVPCCSSLAGIIFKFFPPLPATMITIAINASSCHVRETNAKRWPTAQRTAGARVASQTIAIGIFLGEDHPHTSNLEEREKEVKKNTTNRTISAQTGSNQHRAQPRKPNDQRTKPSACLHDYNCCFCCR